MGGTRIMVIPQSSKLKPGVRFPCTARRFINLIKTEKKRFERNFSGAATRSGIIIDVTLYFHFFLKDAFFLEED